MTRPYQKAESSHFPPFWKNRPDLLKVLRELLLEQICLREQEALGEHLDGKTEKTLGQMAVQLRGELGHFIQANLSSKPRDELGWPPGAQLAKAAEASRVEQKDASVQTMAVEGDTVRFGHEGTTEPWEEKPTDAVFGAEPQPESLCGMPGRQAAALSFPRGTEKVSFPTYYLLSYLLNIDQKLKNHLRSHCFLKICMRSGVSLCLYLILASTWRCVSILNFPKVLPAFPPSLSPPPSQPSLLYL